MKVMSLFCRETKTVDLPSVLTCRVTSFVYLRHIHLSSRQGTTYPRLTFILSRDKNCLFTWCFNLSRDIIWMLTTYPLQLVIRYDLSESDVYLVVRQKLSFHLVLELVMRHLLNACDISTSAREKVRLIRVLHQNHAVYHILNTTWIDSSTYSLWRYIILNTKII